ALPQDAERLAEAVLTTAPKAFGLFQHTLVPTTGARASLYAGHFSLTPLRSTVGQKQLDALFHCGGYHVVVAQASLALAGLADHAVLQAHLGAAHAAGPRELEALGCGAVGL